MIVGKALADRSVNGPILPLFRFENRRIGVGRPASVDGHTPGSAQQERRPRTLGHQAVRGQPSFIARKQRAGWANGYEQSGSLARPQGHVARDRMVRLQFQRAA